MVVIFNFFIMFVLFVLTDKTEEEADMKIERQHHHNQCKVCNVGVCVCLFKENMDSMIVILSRKQKVMFPIVETVD